MTTASGSDTGGVRAPGGGDGTGPDGGASAPLSPPAGMRDFLYPESVDRGALASQLTRTFDLYGYDLAVTPPFELAHVVERAIDAAAAQDLLRFVDPQTGEVALLRPDITPQIARLVAMHRHTRPSPWRLSYRGTVIRRRKGRARKHRQVVQAGVECIGLAGTAADVEIIALCARACRNAGLENFRIELNHVSVGREALARVPASLRADATTALSQKDTAGLAALLARGGVTGPVADALLTLPTLFGDGSVLARAKAALKGPSFDASLLELGAVVDGLQAEGLGAHLLFDLGELRGMSYYTGTSFTLLADGPGEAIGAGGRYDNLLGRFGAPAPATGFAIDVTNLMWALTAAGKPFAAKRPVRVALVDDGTAQDANAAAAQALRAAGIVTASIPAEGALAFAKAWHYDAVVTPSGAGLAATRVDGTAQTFASLDDTTLRAFSDWVRKK